MTNNQNRSNRFEEVVIVYGDDESDANLIDLLADAMHWCDHTGRDFHIALAQACRHYIHELNDQQQDERRLIP
jgi:hypothetical protein